MHEYAADEQFGRFLARLCHWQHDATDVRIPPVKIRYASRNADEEEIGTTTGHDSTFDSGAPRNPKESVRTAFSGIRLNPRLLLSHP